MKEIISLVEKYKQLILDAERYIWNNPETGYKEFKTSAYMKNVFESLGYELILAEGITGFYTIFDTGMIFLWPREGRWEIAVPWTSRHITWSLRGRLNI